MGAQGALREMQRSVLAGALASVGAEEGGFKVLVTDEVARKVLSAVAKMSDLVEMGYAVVEDLAKARKPNPTMDAVYLVTPEASSVRAIAQDFYAGREMYRSAHVFFTRALDPGGHALAAIRDSPGLVSRLATLKELNAETLSPEARIFSTMQPDAMGSLYGTMAGATSQQCGLVAASRLATLLLSMSENPEIRFRRDGPAGSTCRYVAEALQSRIRGASGQPPPQTSSVVIITDRSFDVVAPVMYEWTYHALAADILPDMARSGLFEYTAKLGNGQTQKRMVYLKDDGSDALWERIRHVHVADASTTIDKEFDKFVQKSRQAGLKVDMSSASMAQAVKALPSYKKTLDRLSVHIDMASQLNELAQGHLLDESSALQQDLIFGNAKGKDIISFFNAHPALDPSVKKRILMVYAATHPRKFDNSTTLQWMKIARLSPRELGAIQNLQMLGVAVHKNSPPTAVSQMANYTEQKDGNAVQYKNCKFVPALQALIADAAYGRLDPNAYPALPRDAGPRAEAPSFGGSGPSAGGGGRSMRTARLGPGGSAPGDWASASVPAEGRGGLTPSSSSRVFVFVLGGLCYSEARLAYDMTKRTQKDVFLGSTSLDNALTFVDKIEGLGDSDAQNDLDPFD